MSLGAFCTSPVDSILSEAGQPPLHIRREKLSLVTAAKLASTPENPAYDSTFQGNYQDKYQQCPKSPRTVYFRIGQALSETNLEIPKVPQKRPHTYPPWKIPLLKIILDLQELPKNQTKPIEYKAAIENITQNLQNYIHIYTDGSMSTTGAGCSVGTPEANLQFRLPESYPIFRCETYAILKAILYIEDSNRTKFIIFSDSLSGIKAINNFNKFDHITEEIQESTSRSIDQGKDIILFWIPSHKGIEGNEKADALSKLACLLPEPDEAAKTESWDLRKFFNRNTAEIWNNVWKSASATKFHEIKTNVFEKNKILLKNRRDQVTLNRLRIGHSHFTHYHLISKLEPAKCDVYQAALSIKHVLIECPGYEHQRRTHNLPNELTKLLTEPSSISRSSAFSSGRQA